MSTFTIIAFAVGGVFLLFLVAVVLSVLWPSKGSDSFNDYSTFLRASQFQQAAWAVETGEQVKREADDLGITRERLAAVAKLMPSAMPAGDVSVRGAVTCHGCSTTIRFQQTIINSIFTAGVGGGGAQATCSTCRNRISFSAYPWKLGGGRISVFFCASPYTVEMGERSRPIVMTINEIIVAKQTLYRGG